MQSIFGINFEDKAPSASSPTSSVSSNEQIAQRKLDKIAPQQTEDSDCNKKNGHFPDMRPKISQREDLHVLSPQPDGGQMVANSKRMPQTCDEQEDLTGANNNASSSSTPEEVYLLSLFLGVLLLGLAC